MYTVQRLILLYELLINYEISNYIFFLSRSFIQNCFLHQNLFNIAALQLVINSEDHLNLKLLQNADTSLTTRSAKSFVTLSVITQFFIS